MEIKSFLNESPTAFHAVKNVAAYLDGKGFERIYVGEKNKFVKGGKYYVVKNGSAIIAFVIGSLENYAFNIAESHTDSPSLRIKGNVLLDSPEGKKLNVEKYGGLILYSMADIPLKIAGRVMVKDGKSVRSELVESDFYVNIPSLAIHHNPEVNDKCSFNVQTDMSPLVGDAESVYELVTDKEVIDADLFVVPAVSAYNAGKNGEYLVSPRIDNLSSVYSSIEALVNCKPSGVAMACCFDNEEVGSLTKQGADSAFLPDLLKAINDGLGYGEADFAKAKNDGFVLSVDNGHAVHQAHPEKSDVAEKVYLNKGVVIKHHTNYSTDGATAAVVKAIFAENGIEYQDYYNRSDLRCGGTLGLMSSAALQMNACDIGLAQLAMHSAVETAGSSDVKKMTDGIEAFFNASIKERGGVFSF